MPERVGELGSSNLSLDMRNKLETLQTTLGTQTLTAALGTPAAEQALQTARTNNDVQTVQALTRYIELSRFPLTEAQDGLMAGARLQLEQDNVSGFREGVAAVSAFNSDIFQAATAGMSVGTQMRFAQFWVDNVNFDTFEQGQLATQMSTARELVSAFNMQENVGMSERTVTEVATAMATIEHAEILGTDLEKMRRLWDARNMDELRSAAENANFSIADLNALDSFTEGPEGGTEISAASEAVVLGMLDILRSDMDLSKDQKEKLDKIIEEEEEKKEEEKERREEHES